MYWQYNAPVSPGKQRFHSNRVNANERSDRVKDLAHVQCATDQGVAVLQHLEQYLVRRVFALVSLQPETNNASAVLQLLSQIAVLSL